MQTRPTHVFRGRWSLIGALSWMLQGVLLVPMNLQTADLARAQEPAPAAKCPPAVRIDSAKDTYGTTIVTDPYPGWRIKTTARPGHGLMPSKSARKVRFPSSRAARN